ncbi:MAG: hypothetical protein GY797_39415 [Deltaproteobacteria bacterium]|nr:hypothetical protein [Deltaproteobacteria bacterium]
MQSSNDAKTPPNKGEKSFMKLRLLEIGCACGVTLASKVILLARNRVNFGR